LPGERYLPGLRTRVFRLDDLTFFLKPLPPFRLDLSVWVLRRRPENAIDRWDGQTYQRVHVMGDKLLMVAVQQAGSADTPRLRITASGREVPPNTRTWLAKALRRLMGTQIDLAPFYRLAGLDKKLWPLTKRFEGVKPPRFATVFEALINGIACQQLSLSVGIRLLNRLAEAFGLVTFVNGVPAYAFPRPQDLARLKPGDFRKLGLNRQKARAIIELSIAVVKDRLNLESLEGLNDEQVVERLCELRGVGRWTAEYVLLRGLGRLHIFPGDDVGARNQLQRWLRLRKPLDYQGVHRVLAPWHPFGGLIYFHLLMSGLDDKGYLK